MQDRNLSNMRLSTHRLTGVLSILLTAGGSAQERANRPDGIYAEIQTTKGKIVARLEADLTPLKQRLDEYAEASSIVPGIKSLIALGVALKNH